MTRLVKSEKQQPCAALITASAAAAPASSTDDASRVKALYRIMQSVEVGIGRHISAPISH